MYRKLSAWLQRHRKQQLSSPKPHCRNASVAAFVMLLAPVMLYAQNAIPIPAPSAIVITGPRFFVALVVGIVLALAFELILTNLSVATGLNLLGSATSGKAQGSSEHQGSSVQQSARKISSAFGIWALILSSISLFFAGFLASRVSLSGSATVGAILGLTIWGLFYLINTVFEVSAVSSMVGALANMVKNSVRSSYAAVSSLFKKSPADEMANTAARITDSVREQFFGSRADFRGQLQNYIQQLTPSQPQPEQIAQGIMKVLNSEEIKAATSNDGQQTILQFLQKGGMNRENSQAVVRGMQGAYAKIKQEAGAPKGTTEKVTDTAMRMAGMSGKEAEDTRTQIENYLRSTGKDQLNPEGIKHDIEQLIRNPKAGAQSLKARAGSIDKSTVATLLAQRKDISQDQANKIVNQVDDVLKSITGKTEGATAGVESKVTGAMGGVTSKVQKYLDSLGRPELKYEGIKHDLQTLFHDPKAGAEDLLNRFKSMDRDTIKALLASRKDLSEQDAENILNRIESTRDEMVDRATQMKDEVTRRLEQAKDEAIHQADETRKTAAVAAWWMFGIALVSGVFALLGGIAGT